MDSAQIIELMNKLDEQVVFIVMKFLLGVIILMLLKTVAENIVGYLMFRFDGHISIGTPVDIYGKKGRIKEASIFTISIETDCGYIRVPCKYWRTSKAILLKDDLNLRNRRSTDRQGE